MQLDLNLETAKVELLLDMLQELWKGRYTDEHGAGVGIPLILKDLAKRMAEVMEVLGQGDESLLV